MDSDCSECGKTEPGKGVYVSIQGRQAQKAMQAFRRRMRAWKMTAPAVEPLILDFGLGDFESVGLIECWIANELREGYCGKFLFVFDGQSCPMHHHKEKHETFLLMHGKVRMTCGQKTWEMSPGEVLPVAPGTVHGFTGIGAALLLEVSRPCTSEDNYFEDVRLAAKPKR